jgi:hypothetical protein
MTKKTFIAQQWFQSEAAPSEELARSQKNHRHVEEKETKQKIFPTFTHSKGQEIPLKLDDSKFSPAHCFVPGWKGDSLSSRQVIQFEKLLKNIQDDVRHELLKTKDFPRSIKMGLYNEFLSFAESLGLHFDGLDDLGKFWQTLHSEDQNRDKSISDFLDIYAGRIATITFLKLRFIGTLTSKCAIEVTERALLSPTAYLSQFFKKGSANEINSRALESNLYSWYRPQETMKECMRELLKLSQELAITEIIKNVSVRTQTAQEKNRVYSHAISQVSFGLFLNSLQINFPLWLDTIEGKQTYSDRFEDEEIISCKYFGDYLESLSLSHWLAQENNLNGHWDQILCPDFKGFDFISGVFTKICNELQFLTFLVNKAEHQQKRPVEYISKIMGSHFRNRKNSSQRQASLLEENPFYASTYDRVVLNLCHFPKNNPQHFLMSQILDQVKYLKPQGYLFVLSSKKLFVPSLRERLDPLLKELKTEAIFDFENVKGKGELGSYVYVFRKRDQQKVNNRQLCSYFRVSADLKTFQEFSPITDYLRSFFLSHLEELPAMAQLEFSDTFRIEYYQEAIVNGMLIHSTNEDSSRITHPAFFKGLLNSCTTLDTLFDIKSINSKDVVDQHELAFNLGFKKDISYFLLVDFRKTEIQIELHPMDTFRSIHSDYGETLCCYFQLQPKFPGLNPNLLRNYFVTPIGKQVINLTFSGGLSLVKGALSKLLVPKFLMETDKLPSQMKASFEIFERNEEQLLEISTENIFKFFQHTDQIVRDMLPKYACEILSYYSHFERTLQSLIWKMEDQRFGQKISFSNPLVQSRLVKKSTSPLYPNNADVYFELIDGFTPIDLHQPLTSTQLKVTHEGDLKFYFLELISNDRAIVRLHGEEITLSFLNFILAQAVQVPIAKILKAVHIPSFIDLKDVLESTHELKDVFLTILNKAQSTINSVFQTHVISSRRET